MPDLSLVPSIVWIIASGGPGTDVTPIDSATSSIVSYVLGYGLAGLIALAFAFRFIVPASVLKEARENARADLKAELDRTIAEKREAEEQRDEALRLAQSQLVPILVQFTSATDSLLPLLRELLSRREGRYDQDPGNRR